MAAACGSGPGPTPQVSLSTIMKLWLPRVFAHEIDHSVRIATGVGIWPSRGARNACCGRRPSHCWSAITATASDAILAGSHYQPCPS
jgi:hypothetical protein